MTQANAWDRIGTQYRHEPATARAGSADAQVNPTKPRIKRGLLGATACSVEDALAVRDYEIALLRRDYRELRWAAEAQEAELNQRLDEARRRGREREAELNARLADFDEAAKARYEELRSDHDALRVRLEELERLVGNPDRARGANLTAVPG
jgi:uncharacterized protein YlxW (UPF0749 family)